MEKQRMEEKVMEENKKTNPDSERKQKLVSAILMAFVCVLMMGGGTYAWFTMSNNAKVTSLKLNVASEGNLYIGRTEAEAKEKKTEVTWYGEADTTDTTTITTLYPCTTNNGVNMYKPVYASDDEVTGVEAIAGDATDKDSYYLQKSFWLLLDDGLDAEATHSNYTVHLANGTDLDDATKADGTYFICTEGEENLLTYFPQYCVRVSFTVDGTTYVYEPNSNGDNITTGDNGMKIAKNSIPTATFTPVTSGYQQYMNGTWAGLADGAKESKEMFTITGGTAKEVVVRVWFEGTDDDCGNDIELNDIMGQFKFVANKTTTTSGS